MLEHNAIIKESWTFFKDNFSAIVKFMLPIVIVTSIVSDLLIALLPMDEEEDMNANAWLLFYSYFLIKANFYALDVALFLHFMKNYFEDGPLGSKALLLSFVPRLPSLILLTTLAATFIFVGLLLMIFPGLWLALRFSYAWMYQCFEDMNPFSSLFRSFQESKDDTALIIKSSAVIAIPFLFFTIFYIIIMGIFFRGFLLTFILSIISSLVFLFLQTVLYRIYSQYGHKNA